MAIQIKKIGIVGAGLMGNGIAHVCGLAGFDVYLMDVNPDHIQWARENIDSNLRRQVGRNKISDGEREAALAHIVTGTKMDGFKDCDLVIEAVNEDEELKKQVYAALCPLLREDAILATNTSSISITRLAAQTDRPGRFLGMHFMNPVPMMVLVELIRGIATEPDIFDAVRELTQALGKKSVSAEDFPAFIVNRILLPMINEAVYTLYEGVGTVAAIDEAMRLGANHPMGPLELADFIGLDTCLAVISQLHDGLADSKYRPCPLLVKYVEAGWLGKKAGRGFYDYSSDPPVPTR